MGEIWNVKYIQTKPERIQIGNINNNFFNQQTTKLDNETLTNSSDNWPEKTKLKNERNGEMKEGNSNQVVFVYERQVFDFTTVLVFLFLKLFAK